MPGDRRRELEYKKFRIYAMVENRQDREINCKNYTLVYASAEDKDMSIKGYLENLRKEGKYDARVGDVVAVCTKSGTMPAYYIADPEEYSELFQAEDDNVEPSEKSDIRLVEVEDFFDPWNKGKPLTKAARGTLKCSELYEEGLAGIKAIDNIDDWKALLDSFTRLYRYSYRNNILIEAQQPGATFLASREDWTDKYRADLVSGQKMIRFYAYSNKRYIRMRPEYEIKALSEIEEELEHTANSRPRGNFGVSMFYDISQVRHPAVPGNILKPLDVSADIIAGTLNRMLGNNPGYELVRRSTDIKAIESELLVMYMMKNAKSLKRSELSVESEKYVLSKALNIPLESSLERFSDSLGRFDMLAASKVVKSDTSGILKKIESELYSDAKPMSLEMIRNSGKFSEEQLRQFDAVHEHGLHVGEIVVAADPCYDADVIHNAINSSFIVPPEKLHTFVRDHDAGQINEIIKAHINTGAGSYQTAVVNCCDTDSENLKFINRAAAAGASAELIQLLISDRFSCEQLNELVKAIEDKLPYEEIKFMADKNCSPDQMHRLRLAFAEKRADADAVRIFREFGIDSSVKHSGHKNSTEAEEKGKADAESNSLRSLVEDARNRIAGKG